MISVGDNVNFNNKTWQVTRKLLVEEAQKECPEHSVTKVMEEREFSLLELECDTPRTLDLMIVRIHSPTTTEIVFCNEKDVIYPVTDFKAEIDKASKS